MPTVTYRWETEDHDATFEVTGSVSAYYPAVIGGPPESCSPAEGGEVEIESVELVELHNGEVTPEVKAELERLFQAELDEQGPVWESVDEKLFEAAQEDRYEPPDWY